MYYRNLFRFLTLLTILLVGAACSGAEEPPQNEPEVANETAENLPDAGAGVREDGAFRIVATTTQAMDIAQILTAGVDGVEIIGLMGAGVDPHLYQPTESDIAAMNEADMVVYSGLHLEGQFDAVFEALGQQGVFIYAMSDPVKNGGFTIGGFDLSEELVNVDDPHYWFDPRNWELTVTDLADELAEIDPDNAATYAANAEAYTEQLAILYEWADTGMKSVAGGQRYLVTSHDAFQYFGAAFGWRMAAIQGLSTEDEAGVGDIQGVVDFIIENEIPVVFVESSIPPDTIEAVIEAVKAEDETVRIGVREMYSDAMGEPGTFGGTYIGMIAENVYTILQSYQCEGAEVTIPDWPESLTPTPPDELLNVDCSTG
ncbi:metal ABC transporter solute-binding protein, Zn/Mn family [Candidatus Leptofilum sp.]|uniref:metal ABC transporter solute-binding protein, Zn/Mn family n=1 Tax=Candidatus Leptofilum sp. TaxID=3241576 RepID=UPI003B590E8B